MRPQSRAQVTDAMREWFDALLADSKDAAEDIAEEVTQMTQEAHALNLSGLVSMINRTTELRDQECFSCGEIKPMSIAEHEHGWFDAGEWESGMFCDGCRAKDKHKLLP